MQGLLKKAENIELKVKQLKTRLEMLDKENAFYREENKNLVEKLKQQNIALNETYRVAIIKRVLASRKTTQIKTATGTSTQ